MSGSMYAAGGSDVSVSHAVTGVGTATVCGVETAEEDMTGRAETCTCARTYLTEQHHTETCTKIQHHA